MPTKTLGTIEVPQLIRDIAERTVRCSKAPFSKDELDILERDRREFERLTNGKRAPQRRRNSSTLHAGGVPPNRSTNASGRNTS